MRVRFDKEKCTGCYACYVACTAAHHKAEEENGRSCRRIALVRVEEDGFQKNICLGCTHCGLCMKACLAGAIYREEGYGLVLINPVHCTGCGACLNSCPQGVIELDEQGKARKCDGCIDRLKQGREPACMRACCTGAIEMDWKQN